MRTLEENYAVFERLVDEEMIYLTPDYGFGRVCRMLGVARAEMDALLTLPPQIYDAFAYKTSTATEDGETIDLKLCAGSDFDVEFLTTHETFVACITMNVTTIRDIS